MIDQLKDALTSLSDEVMDNALARCDQSGFNPLRGEVALEAAMDNIQQDRDLLLHLTERQVLSGLPVAAQQKATSLATQAVNAVTQLSNGQDTVPQVAQAAERLRDFIWRYHLRLLTKELVGFEGARQRLKTVMADARRMRSELQNALDKRDKLEALVTQADQTVAQAQVAVQKAASASSETGQCHQEALNAAEQARSSMTTATEYQAQISELLASSREQNSEVASFAAGLDALFKEGEEFRQTMQASTETFRADIAKTTAQAGVAVAEHNQKTDAVIARLEQQQAQINDLLQKATGESLFRAFEQRRQELTVSKWLWAGALSLTAVASGIVSVWIARSAVHLSEAFYIKLAMAPVLMFGLWFCAVQYGRERKLEEEYAFKSKVSLSLSAYKELVEAVVGPDPSGREKYTDFVVDSVGRVFSSPVQEVFIVRERGLSAKLLNQSRRRLAAS